MSRRKSLYLLTPYIRPTHLFPPPSLVVSVCGRHSTVPVCGVFGVSLPKSSSVTPARLHLFFCHGDAKQENRAPDELISPPFGMSKYR